MLFTAPVGYDGVFWEYVRIAPRLSIDAGFELGSGVGINITAPEDAARYLREASMASA
jgi:UDPglucose--hexose-1-phosphate uridylyltransferase